MRRLARTRNQGPALEVFRTKKEADDFRDTVSVEIRQGTYTGPRPIPFKTFAEGWLARTRPTATPNAAALHEGT